MGLPRLASADNPQKQAAKQQQEAAKQAKKAAQAAQKQAEQQRKEAEKRAKQQQEERQKVMNSEMNLREGAIIKEAYMVLAIANHNYDGHRARAMGLLEDAATMLDRNILKNGTNQQKVMALEHDKKAYQAKFLAKHQAAMHEPQALSDLQMNEGLNMLLRVRPTIIQRQQKGVLDKVDSAIAEIRKGLAYRAAGGK
jgi:hypothetical protein